MKGIVYLGGEKLPGHGALELWLRAQIFLEHECYRRCEGKSLGGWFGSGSGAFWIVFLSSFKPYMESELWGSRKSWALSDGPVIRIPHFHCQGPGFDS